jgi:hypothetical protein
VLETRWYAQPGIAALAYGAGPLDVSQGPDEFIGEAAMRRCAAVYMPYGGKTTSYPRSTASSRAREASRKNATGRSAWSSAAGLADLQLVEPAHPLLLIRDVRDPTPTYIHLRWAA